MSVDWRVPSAIYAVVDKIEFNTIKEDGEIKYEYDVYELLKSDGPAAGFKNFFDVLKAVEYVRRNPRSKVDTAFCAFFLEDRAQLVMTVCLCSLVTPTSLKKVIMNFGHLEIPDFILRRAQKLKQIHTISDPDLLNIMLWRYRLWHQSSHAEILSFLLSLAGNDLLLDYSADQGADIIKSYVIAVTKEMEERISRRSVVGRNRVVYRTIRHIMTTLADVKPQLSFNENMGDCIGELERLVSPVFGRCSYCGKPYTAVCAEEDKEYKELRARFMTLVKK
jgi:bacterioferritin-associated ferredoxin